MSATATRRRTAVLDEVHRRLESQAYLFDDPRAYRAGVQDTLRALAAVVELRRQREGVAA